MTYVATCPPADHFRCVAWSQSGRWGLGWKMAQAFTRSDGISDMWVPERLVNPISSTVRVMNLCFFSFEFYRLLGWLVFLANGK